MKSLDKNFFQGVKNFDKFTVKIFIIRFSASASIPIQRKSMGIEGIPNEANPLVDTSQPKENVSGMYP